MGSMLCESKQHQGCGQVAGPVGVRVRSQTLADDFLNDPDGPFRLSISLTIADSNMIMLDG